MEQKIVKETFSNEIREIVNNVSLHATTHGNYEVISQESSNDMVLIVTNRTYLLDMEEIALALSSADHIVRYLKGTNFLSVEKNPYPTPEAIPDKLACTPISFAEAIKKLQGYKDQVEVVLPEDAEVNCATIVAKQSWMRPVLSEIAMMLSTGGMFVNYHEGCNFIEFEECIEYEVTMPIIRIKTNFHPNEAAVLAVDKVAMG